MRVEWIGEGGRLIYKDTGDRAAEELLTRCKHGKGLTGAGSLMVFLYTQGQGGNVE